MKYIHCPTRKNVVEENLSIFTALKGNEIQKKDAPYKSAPKC